MTGSESILNKAPEELGRFLLEAARQDSAPRAARERALLSVTSVALGMGVASSAVAYGSPTSLAKASAWLVAKWLVLGLGSGVLTIAVAQGVQQVITNHTQAASPAAVTAIKGALRRNFMGAVLLSGTSTAGRGTGDGTISRLPVLEESSTKPQYK